jgi:hypothetical protein
VPAADLRVIAPTVLDTADGGYRTRSAQPRGRSAPRSRTALASVASGVAAEPLLRVAERATGPMRDLVERRWTGRSEDVDAVPVVFDHSGYAAHFTFDAVETSE